MKYHFCIYSKEPQRVDMYISTLFSDISRSYIQKLIDTGCVIINAKEVKKNLKVKHRDEIHIQEIIISSELVAQNIPLHVLYEDENICIINKEAGINVHPTPGMEGKRNTLVNALLYHCKQNLPVISGEERPGIVHRLDKNTSGAIMVAKNDTMMRYLSGIIKERKVKKYYIAIVAGILTEKEFTIRSDIGRDSTDRTRMTAQSPINPKNAVTHGQVVGYIEEKYSILKIDLETGRTHQIRVHLASIGYPIIGDSVYGNEDVNREVEKSFGIKRQALHASELHFELYQKKFSIKAPLFPDMLKIYALL